VDAQAQIDPDEARLVLRLPLLRRRFPTIEDLEKRAARRIPRFAFEFLQGGAGDESGLARNRSALRGIEIVPRYGHDVRDVDPSVELFGRRYAAPIGISPIGMDGLMWPGATELFARAAQRMNVPYLVGTLATASIEDVARWAPDVTWFQLYPVPADDHRVSFDLARRAQAAGARALVATLDVPVRSKRPRDLRNGFVMPFRLGRRNALDIAASPAWLRALARRGKPGFANILPYAGERDPAAFVGAHVGGGFAWDVLERLRDGWRGPMLVKGVLHPADAERARAIGMDGVIVSNHGGRQFDAAPASVDMLPAIASAVGTDVTVILDSGVTSGVDMMRALACGARSTFAGRAFMLALAAIGDDGARHMAASFIDEFTIALGQSGLRSAAEARHAPVRHATAWPRATLGGNTP
jgi:L-lactate dehydrogenase (cytochrome)